MGIFKGGDVREVFSGGKKIFAALPSGETPSDPHKIPF
jgi:hypothetical protein